VEPRSRHFEKQVGRNEVRQQERRLSTAVGPLRLLAVAEQINEEANTSQNAKRRGHRFHLPEHMKSAVIAGVRKKQTSGDG
jgi:hypothetical protein